MKPESATSQALYTESLFVELMKDHHSLNFSFNAQAFQNRLHPSLQSQHGQRKGFFGQTSGNLAFDHVNCQSASMSSVVIGNPYWAETELQLIAKQQGHAQALLQAYQRYGDNFLNSIKGAFALILVDHNRLRSISCIDRLGQFSLYFAETPDSWVIASDVSYLLSHPKVDKEITEQGLYNYIYFHMVPAPGTIYRGIQKLQAAHRLIIDNNHSCIDRYWTPSFSEHSSKNIDEYSEQLREHLHNSVNRAAQYSDNTGCFLSGGLDSSSVAGFMSQVSNGEAFSIGFSADGYDEMEYARLTAKHFKVKLNEYYVTPDDVVEALPLIAGSYLEPFGNSSALPAYFCARLASEQGITALLAGDGGDELFAGNERYGHQNIFSPYLSIPPSLRQAIINPLINKLPDGFPLASKAQSYLKQANTPLPDRLQTYNFLHQFSPSSLFRQDFLEATIEEQPLNLQRQIYNSPEDCSTLNRQLYLDWQFTLADNDLRKVSHMCALAGTKVHYPMLDDELVEFSCQIPSRWKLKSSPLNSNQGLRHFYKYALKGWLPDATINKSKQGFGLPFGVWLTTHKPLREMAYEALDRIKQRKIFHNAFIDRCIKLHREGHAAYYGELIWLLMVLEFWLERHQSSASMERVA